MTVLFSYQKMTNNTPLSEMSAKAEEFIDSVRRQAPAARMIGEFAVKQGWDMLLQRLQVRPTGAATSGPERSVAIVEPNTDAGPFIDYSTRTARQIIETLTTLTPLLQRSILEYELVHRNRVTVIQACRRALGDTI
ncbi:MAG: hypothetical protein EXQ63_00485 [Ilumatobacteraceae bacterium]|nr:hypothetical protein [Ilumatobacteraceae bacterium]